MSAIGAVFHRSGRPVDQRALNRMRNALRLHGADRDTIATDRDMGLVWTHGVGFTPQDHRERQPIRLRSGGWLVFAGRLDHREELCAALALGAAEGSTLADGVLVRHAWEAWGESAVERLHGDFGIIVVDAGERRLVAVRGPLRGHPIHYHETADRLVLASMPKGIFALGDVPREVDDQHLADALVLNYEDRHSTFFKGIRSLPLGHMLVADPQRLTVSRFYDLRNTPMVRFSRDADYVEAAGAHLAAAVGASMRSVETPALALSSGLDSTAVAVTALEWLSARSDVTALPLLGVVAVPEPGWDGRVPDRHASGDESGPVRIFASRYPALDLRFVDSAGLPLDYELDKVLMTSDMPVRGAGTLHNGIELERYARRQGRRVMLTGSGGNATLSMAAGMFVLGGLFRSGRWLTLAHELRMLNQRQHRHARFGLSGLFSQAIVPNLPQLAHALYVRSQTAPHRSDWQRFSAIHPAFAEAMRVDARLRELDAVGDPRRRQSRRARMAFMLDRGNRHQSGALALGFEAVSGVQIRDPLRDRKLVEFCYAIPDDQFFKKGVDRALIKRVMAERLPGAILNAPRGRMGADWHMRLRRDIGRHQAELEQLSEDPAIAERIDIGRLRQALATLPDQTPLTRKDHPERVILELGYGRAVAAARFVRAIEGRNR